MMPQTEKKTAPGRTGGRKGNPDNIRKLNLRRTQEERKEAARKAGKASAIARQTHKSFKEALLTILEMPTTERPELSYRDAIAIAMIEKAATGDKGAAEYVRDTIGEKPTDKMSADLTNSDGTLATRGAGLDLSTWTPEQVAELCHAAFSNGGE